MEQKHKKYSFFAEKRQLAEARNNPNYVYVTNDLKMICLIDYLLFSTSLPKIYDFKKYSLFINTSFKKIHCVLSEWNPFLCGIFLTVHKKDIHGAIGVFFLEFPRCML